MCRYKYEYSIKISKLSDEDGGGWLAEVPELPGCMSDGATIPEAIESVNGAIEAWIETAREAGREIPNPVKAA
jgi:predicted RNase H-like HicB family nuclease